MVQMCVCVCVLSRCCDWVSKLCFSHNLFLSFSILLPPWLPVCSLHTHTVWGVHIKLVVKATVSQLPGVIYIAMVTLACSLLELLPGDSSSYTQQQYPSYCLLFPSYRCDYCYNNGVTGGSKLSLRVSVCIFVPIMEMFICSFSFHAANNNSSAPKSKTCHQELLHSILYKAMQWKDQIYVTHAFRSDKSHFPYCLIFAILHTHT